MLTLQLAKYRALCLLIWPSGGCVWQISQPGNYRARYLLIKTCDRYVLLTLQPGVLLTLEPGVLLTLQPGVLLTLQPANYGALCLLIWPSGGCVWQPVAGYSAQHRGRRWGIGG